METLPLLSPFTQEELARTQADASKRIALADKVNRVIYRVGCYGMLAFGLGVFLYYGYTLWSGNGVPQLFATTQPLAHSEHAWLVLLALITASLAGCLVYGLRHPQGMLEIPGVCGSMGGVYLVGLSDVNVSGGVTPLLGSLVYLVFISFIELILYLTVCHWVDEKWKTPAELALLNIREVNYQTAPEACTEFVAWCVANEPIRAFQNAIVALGRRPVYAEYLQAQKWVQVAEERKVQVQRREQCERLGSPIASGAC